MAAVQRGVHRPPVPLQHPRCLDGGGVRLARAAGAVKAALADALGDIAASREAAKVPVKKAIRCTRGDKAERERLYSLLKQNRWTEDSFLHRQMRKQWRGGRSHVTNQIVADSGSYTTKVWNGRAWV